MDDKIITRAYILHTGEIGFSNTKFSNFLATYPGLAQRYSKDTLQRMIKANLVELSADLNPIVDANELVELMGKPDVETKDFLITIHEKPLTDVVAFYNNFRFKSAKNKTNIKNALHAVYGADDTALGMDALGGEVPDMAPEQDSISKPADTEAIQPLEDATDTLDDLPTEDAAPTESLDPAVEEDAIFTIEGYLQTDVFNSKLIPVVKVIKAEKLKNGYVLHLAFTSKDEQSSAYATAVVHNKKLVLPAELYSDEGMTNKLGDFNPETFTQAFTVAEQKKSIPTDNYSEMMDQMASSPSTVEANVVLEKILRKFGQEVAASSWESYIRLKTHQGQKAKNTAASRLNVTMGHQEEK